MITTFESILNFFFSSDSGKTFPYSSLDKCFSLYVTQINQQVGPYANLNKSLNVSVSMRKN